jgi:hypothetical protein
VARVENSKAIAIAVDDECGLPSYLSVLERSAMLSAVGSTNRAPRLIMSCREIRNGIREVHHRQSSREMYNLNLRLLIIDEW